MWQLRHFSNRPFRRHGPLKRGPGIDPPVSRRHNRRFAFPLVVIDFEATALSHGSYPIEVGIAIAVSSQVPIKTWSSLILPAPTWDMASQWDPDAERLHGISRWNLRNGATARHVMEKINALIGPIGQAWCDGGDYDSRWLTTLAIAAGVLTQFELRDIVDTLNADQALHSRYRAALAGSRPPHRAGPDAERICAALASLIQHRRTQRPDGREPLTPII